MISYWDSKTRAQSQHHLENSSNIYRIREKVTVMENDNNLRFIVYSQNESFL